MARLLAPGEVLGVRLPLVPRAPRHGLRASKPRAMFHPMDVTLVRVDSGNLSVLERVDPECFDEPIDMARAARCVSSPDALLVVAVAGGLVVGQCLAAIHRHPDKATELYVDDLAVAPMFHRQGIARRLVEACIGSGRDAGAETAWVATEPDKRRRERVLSGVGSERASRSCFRPGTHW